MHRSLLIAGLIFALSATCRAADSLVVYEWGTFTSFQDEQGTPFGRINTDDEPIPAFVHQITSNALFPSTITFVIDGKGIPAGNPSVTMRLETPVLYFHLPKNQTAPLKLDVNVAFRGGWLTQYFPDAQASIDGAAATARLPILTSASLGRLSWRGLTLNSNQGAAPQTDDPVWTAPRAVDSTPVSTDREQEQFLFYRGVGHVDSPLRVTRSVNGNTLQVHDAADGLTIGPLWLVDIRADSSVAFRVLPKVTPTDIISTPGQFADEDYSRDNFTRLRFAMHEALIANGLFADEADALLNTWQRSYFQNPGQRLFFIVPRSWTDAVLPLTLSVPAEINRVMVGRIELVTPAQRTILHRMSITPLPDEDELTKVNNVMRRLRNDPYRADMYNALAGGHGNLQDLGMPVPPLYADFLALGRFRAALVLSYIGNSRTLLTFSNLLRQ